MHWWFLLCWYYGSAQRKFAKFLLLRCSFLYSSSRVVNSSSSCANGSHKANLCYVTPLADSRRSSWVIFRRLKANLTTTLQWKQNHPKQLVWWTQWYTQAHPGGSEGKRGQTVVCPKPCICYVKQTHTSTANQNSTQKINRGAYIAKLILYFLGSQSAERSNKCQGLNKILSSVNMELETR